MKLIQSFLYGVLLLICACNNQQAQKDNQAMITKDNAFASLLTQSSGQKFISLGDSASTKGYTVFQNQTTGEYVAYNTSKYDQSTMHSLPEYLNTATGANDVVRNLTQITTIPIWVQTGITAGYYQVFYNYIGGGFTFENKRSTTKDLENVISQASKADTDLVLSALLNQYGFSAERAQKIAMLTKQLKAITSSRELTDTDKNIFTQEALGADFKTLQAALTRSAQGNDDSYQSLLKKAADVNGTTPELSRQLIEDMAGLAE